ncbi:unnamed protein product [Chilo suppressalis]|uniref:PiggyBac transposable element-derived protein domain-containing protein n=1 Tax=Chilo suppressalis TaxID=168631 RepID=A0ABN8BAQ6_CHISP|nr:unnamed protein product [Chilo suppressalis]
MRLGFAIISSLSHKKVQDLISSDYGRRIQSCEGILRSNNDDPKFFDRILWTDESTFTRSGIFNIHNYHSWAAGPLQTRN